MSTPEAALTAFTVVSVLLPVAYFQIEKRKRRPSRRDQIIADSCAGLSVWDLAAKQWVHLPLGARPGPGQMTSRDIAEADQLELLWFAPAYDAELDTGLDRLRQAIRDEQQKQKGEQ